MKQLFLFLLFLGITASAKAQTTFATADTMSVGVLKTGTVNSSTGQHYYKTWLPANQGYFRLVTSTANAGSAFGIVQYRVFWKNQNTINYYNVNRNASTSGADTFMVGPLQADSLYILVDNVWAGQTQNYTLKYDVLNGAPNNETSVSNDTRQTAEILPFNTLRAGSAGFSTPAGADGNDWYKIVFPRNGTFKLYVGTQSMTSSGSNVLPRIYFYDRNGGASLTAFRNNNSSGFTWTHLGNNASQPAFAITADTLNVYGRAADTIYIALDAFGGNWPATYNLRWDVIDTALNNEPGPNETRAQANLLAAGQTINGDISYVGNGADVDDYYRIILPKDGTIMLFASSQNTWNQQANPAPEIMVEDKNGNGILNQNNAGAQSGRLRVANAGAVPFMGSVSDTMHVFGRARDTFYIHIQNYHFGLGWAFAAHYNLRWQLDDTSAFNEIGANDTRATAQPITTADTVRGHCDFVDGQGNTDWEDYYRIVKPANGSLVLYISGRHTYGYGNGLAGLPIVQVMDKNGNLYAIKSGTGAVSGTMGIRNSAYGQVPFGQTRTDTMLISCVATDTVYVKVYNFFNVFYPGTSSDYQFRYEAIPGPKSAFTYSCVGSEFGFVNNSKFADSYLWIMGNGSTYTSYAPPVTTYTIPNAYTVKLVTVQGACGYRDTAFANFTITGIEHYTPKSAGRGGDVAFQIFGGGLDATTSVVFKQGSTTLTPVKQYTNGKQNFLTAVMDLHNVPTGLYDVIITVPGLAPITYTNGFRVDSFQYPYAWSQVSGPSRWLTNRPTRFNLIVGNNGNVMASGVVVAMVWPKTAKLTWLKEPYRPSFVGTDTFVVPVLSKTYTVPRSAYKFIYDSVNSFAAIDTFEGKPYDGYIKFFQVPFIPANTTISIPFNVTSSVVTGQRFYTYTHRPNIFGSCPNGNQEDFMNANSGELIDAVDGFSDKTKIPLFKAFTKTAKIGQFHMRSAATYLGTEFWAWYDGYETDHDANVAEWISHTEADNQAAEQVFAQEVGDALLSHAVGQAKVHNDQVNYYNQLLASNKHLSAESIDKVGDILSKHGKALGNINYNRLELLKKLYDGTKNAGSQSERIAKLLEQINNCPELKDQKKELLDMLGGEQDHNGGSETSSNSVGSFDPNDIYGPSGVGTPRNTNSLQRQPFLVTFENVDTASADAQTVVVLDTIDKTKFDISSLVLGDAVVGGQTFRVPQGRNEFMVQSSMDSIRGIRLRIVATTDTTRGIIRWQFTALDSATNNLPVLKGFLPPNKNGVQGTGSVNYTIKPLASVTDGAVLNSRASIVFDSNAPIGTSTWTNTIDLFPPTSQVLSATHVYDSTIILRFTGSDATSGIQKYKVYYSTNNGPWYQLGDAADDSMLIRGQPDSSYSFYCVAIDKVENREIKAPLAEASVKVPPLGMDNLAGASSCLAVYPNPATDKAYMRVSLKVADEADIQLQSLSGSVVAKLYNGKINGIASLPLDISKTPTGVYFIVLKTGSGLREVRKLVVTH